MRKSLTRALYFGLAPLVWLPALSSAQPEIDWELLGGAPGLESWLEHIDEDVRESFDRMVAESADAIDERPYDVVSRIDHCRLIDEFALRFEYLDWIDDAFEQAEACRNLLFSDWGNHAEVELLKLEFLYGPELVETGSSLIGRSFDERWTEGQKSRLYALLAVAADTIGDPVAVDYAIEALRFDERADVRLIAAAGLSDRGDDERAIELLTSPMDARAGNDGWYLANKLEMLALLGEAEWVISNYPRLLDGEPYYDSAQVARALIEVGAVDLARNELIRQSEYSDYSTEDERERFEFEYKYGSPGKALEAYNIWRDAGWSMDPVGINRMALLVLDRSLPWRGRDFLGLLGAAGAILAIGLAALLPISVVHYRGLAVRARTAATYPVTGWRLRHAWLAMSAFGAAAFFSLYFGGPIDIWAETATVWSVDEQTLRVARFVVAETMLGILFLAPLAWVAAGIQPRWWSERWGIVKCLLIGLGIAMGFRLPLFAASLVAPEWVSSIAADDLIWQALSAVREHYGFLSAILIVAVVAPVIEEFMFRGILLSAFTSHMGFTWANILQAGLFAAIHMEPAAIPVLFLLGAVAGWITRRSGGLLAAMLMHAAYNLAAALIILE